MPKATKLHSKAKGKPSSLQKPCNADKESTDTTSSEDSMVQFQLELCWCIQQLERTLSEKKANEKQMQEAWKVLTVLKNNNQPMVRKRQLMRTHFGDYRAKMAAEEKKLVKMASKMKITDNPAQPKATFLRKSAFLTTGDKTFRFNFNLAPEHIDNNPGISGITGNSNGNPGTSDGNTDGKSKSSQVGNPKITESGDHNTQDSSKFKFTFTESEFKFNFDVDK